jgi:hypothetical protein
MGRKIKVWVEVMTVQSMTSELFDAPDNWDQLTMAERLDHMESLFTDMRDNIANGGYELVED